MEESDRSSCHRFPDQLHDVANIPEPIRNASGHSGRHANAAVDPGEITPGSVKGALSSLQIAHLAFNCPASTFIVDATTNPAGDKVALTLTNLEFRVMEVFWTNGALAVRQVQETLSKEGYPAYTTIQTIIYRLEGKGALRRVRKIGNAHIFETVISPDAVRERN
jgi:hypothetical protein